jgi:hypothetical protein
MGSPPRMAGGGHHDPPLPPSAEGRSDRTEPSHPHWRLVQRVAASARFQRSQRLRELLLFVSERTLREPRGSVHEHDIGTAVFGRPADFMAGEDTLVRVHASRLRKRLEQYFSTEGAAEPVVIEIPKHTYIPVFRQREGNPPPAAEAPVTPAPSRTVRVPRPAALVGAVLAALLLAGTAWLYRADRAWHGRLSRGGLGPRPTVDRLWQDMFGSGRQAYVVLADSNLTMLEDLLRRPVTLLEYQHKRFRVPKEARPTDPAADDLVSRLMQRQFTSIADASLAHRIGLLNAVHGIPTAVISARDAGAQHFKSHHAILAGPRRANPWIELFEDQLNFRTRYDEERRQASFENRAPQPGEERAYEVVWNQLGYCRVAYLPNLDGTGSVLLLSGTEMGSTEAGVDFVTSERWVRRLGSALGVGPRQSFPHFEVLLRTHLLSSASPSFEVVAQRRLGS